MNDGVFKDFFQEVDPIRLREPLAETLGAFKARNSVVEYHFTDLVKMAGHACPTMAGAFLCCQTALEAIYPNEIPVRGEIAVNIHGEADEGVYGVMGQAISFITGAAPSSGFRGLGHRFKRMLSELLEKVIWDAAKEQERREFQDLWMERVRGMLLEKKGIDQWLVVQERSG